MPTLAAAQACKITLLSVRVPMVAAAIYRWRRGHSAMIALARETPRENTASTGSSSRELIRAPGRCDEPRRVPDERRTTRRADIDNRSYATTLVM
jgi:hypothetical protein